MTSFSGFFGCSSCYQKAEYSKEYNKTIWPSEVGQKRTDLETAILGQMAEEDPKDNSYFGVKGYSQLMSWPNCSQIDSVTVDWMHGVCSGSALKGMGTLFS